MEPVNVLVIGDPHFKTSNVVETDAMVAAILRVARERNPDMIVVLGDILDRHENIHVSPLTRAVEFLASLMAIAPCYVLIGNHDLRNNRQFLSSEHPFTALKYWDTNRMKVVDTTCSIKYRGHIFVLLPYTPPGRFMEALGRSDNWEEATCIFAHQEFKGANMGGIISVQGDEWTPQYPYVVSGHEHNYQELGPNILYTGTPIPHAFGDSHDKTISWFTFYTQNRRDHERIDLGLPRKMIVRIMCNDVPTYQPPERCELKIIISGTSAELKTVTKHCNIERWKRMGYKIIYKNLPQEKPGTKSTTTIVPSKPLNFTIELYNSITIQPRLTALFTHLFGKIQLTSPASSHVTSSSPSNTLSALDSATSALNNLTINDNQPKLTLIIKNNS